VANQTGKEEKGMFEQKGVGALAQKEMALTKKMLALQDGLASIEAAAEARLLDADEAGAGGDSDAALVEVGRAQSELRAIRVAIKGARSRRADAIRAGRAGEVAALRKQISAKEDELAKLDAETQKCIDRLSELQRMKYTPGVLMTNPAQGFFETPYGGKLRMEIA
jgi:hypothetical protein